MDIFYEDKDIALIILRCNDAENGRLAGVP